MSLNQCQGQLGDLGYKVFDPAVFLGPLFDLGKQIHRDVSGMGLGFDLPGEVMAGVLVAAGATAVGVAASAADGHKAGGQHGAFGLELLLSGLEEPADQGWMFGYFHTLTRPIFPAWITE